MDPATGDEAEEEDTIPELKEALPLYEKCLSKVKQFKDKVTRELDKVPLVRAKLERKPYDCSKTIAWLDEKTNEVKQLCDDFMRTDSRKSVFDPPLRPREGGAGGGALPPALPRRKQKHTKQVKTNNRNNYCWFV